MVLAAPSLVLLSPILAPLLLVRRLRRKHRQGRNRANGQRAKSENRQRAKQKKGDHRSARRITALRTKLHILGFTERPLEELTEIASSAEEASEVRAKAARELALWHMRAKTEKDNRTALDWIARSRKDAADLDFRAKLATVELLCHFHLGDSAAGLAAYER